MSLEAKDLYSAARNHNPGGYGIRGANGSISIRKFTNSLDYSLDAIKLREVYETVMRNKRFTFKMGKKEYTTSIINIKFTYSYKLYNKSGKNCFIRDGYNFRDAVFIDCVWLKDGVLAGIQTNTTVENKIDDEFLGECFKYQNGVYVETGKNPVIMDRSELREYLYKNGFVCDGVTYTRYKRSCGSSRVGKCLFVDARLSSRMEKWDKCGLAVKEGNEVDLAAWEAYISLPMSSIIGTIDILPENILVIDDYDSVFEEEVVAVDDNGGVLRSEERRAEVSNSIWDGQSLMDTSLFEGEYQDKGMLLLRNQFFKTCAFNTNIQEWFEDNGITEISQLNGYTKATDIRDIKLITTPNSIKYTKFGSVEQWLNNIGITFGVVKYEKKTHFFDGRMVQCHYQLLNTLQLSYDEMEAVLKPSLDYITQVKEDPDVLRFHISYPYDEMEITPLTSKNEIVFKMLGINNKFAKTKLFADFKNDLVKAFLRNLKQGHILVEGNYSTLFGNGVEMLKQAIGRFDGTSEIGVGCVHTTNFAYGETVLGSRSPHILAGNILLATNVANAKIDKYFNLSDEIVCINSIGENIQQRLNG